MGIPVLILGESGSGKSTSLRNFAPGEIGVFNVASKPLPFKKKFTHVCDNATYNKILTSLKNNQLKKYAIDDSQYLLAFEMFDRAKETGYGKFVDLALNFRNLIDFITKNTTPDTIVYLLHHTETSADGKVKAKTIGKMLDEKLTVEGLFSIVLLAQTDGKTYHFETQSNGFNTCKSPMEMFEARIENDLAFVDRTIRKYWQLEKQEEKA